MAAPYLEDLALLGLLRERALLQHTRPSRGAVSPARPSEAAELTCRVQRNAPMALAAVRFSAAAAPPAGQCGSVQAAGDASIGPTYSFQHLSAIILGGSVNV